MRNSNKLGILILGLIIFSAILLTYTLFSSLNPTQLRGRVITTANNTTTILISGQVQQEEVYVPATFFGITLNGANYVHYPILKSVGVLGKTNAANWKRMNPSRNNYSWSFLDSVIAKAKAAKINQNEYTFFMAPAWVNCTNSRSGCGRGDAGDVNMTDFNEFVANVAVHYNGQNGNYFIKYYELWNEPNCGCFWNGTTAQLVALTSNAYSIIKSIDPSAVVLAPGVSVIATQSGQTWLKNYLNAGGAKYADGIAFHAYACVEQTEHCTDPGVYCPQSKILDCAGLPLVHEIQNIQTQMSGGGAGKDPIYVTEGGILRDDFGSITDPNQQAAFVSRWYTILASYNITSAVWYDWDGNGTYGISTWHSAIVAYNQTYNWLNGSTLTAPCSLYYDNSMWECPMTRPDG